MDAFQNAFSLLLLHADAHGNDAHGLNELREQLFHVLLLDDVFEPVCGAIQSEMERHLRRAL